MSNSNLIWIDLEMTGLDPDQHVILEIASVVTDAELNIVAKGPVLAVKHSAETLALMEDWSRTHHTASGLLGRVESSTCTCRQAEKETLAFLSQHCREGRSPLCGNSVWQDRRFLIKYMPALEAFLHYRNIDVSTLKELVRRWYPSVSKFKKSKQHLAMSDIIESIRELSYYRRKVFVN